MSPLRRETLAADPIDQFADWFSRAEREAPLAEAMTLATLADDGVPDARMVLLKGFGPEGFRFFTNYESAKARQLDAHPRAALVIYWRESDRQVRIRGAVRRLGEDDSDAYFATRPRDSQLSAWASPQSQPLGSRQELDQRLRQVEERYAAGAVPRPAHWGGYLLRAETIEFWQGESGRLHDRFRYRRAGEGWAIERLAP